MIPIGLEEGARDLLVVGRFLAPGLAAAFAIGVAAGLARSARRGGRFRVDLMLSVLLLGAAVVLHGVAAGDLVPVGGTALFFADSAALHLAAYLAGVVIACAIRALGLPSGRRSTVPPA